MRLLSLTALVVFGLDQLSKWFVVQYLDLINRGVIEVAPPFLRLTMAWNRGINFGLFANDANTTRWVLIGVAVVICGVVLYWMRGEQNRYALFSGGLLFGGAAGNVIDRIIYGAVADFLNMSCCGIDNPFAFNIADCAIFLGAVGLVIFASDGDKSRQTKA
ncbi:signal peptidase II [Shimia ponticola]|uniref:signal peptidase II n=1 Tax=Shimia ponticola TaxID=2582893 RepID=UPI0011BF5B01|nr:signal peptidase II [Shimia ponticola]